LTKGKRIGRCALCLTPDVKLRDSHLLPAAAYVPLLSSTKKNRNPLVVTDTETYTTSIQVSDYLLCSDCEGRFDKHGEKWTLARMYRAPGDFKFRDALCEQKPNLAGPEGEIYFAAQNPAIKLESVIYFAMSVFWRAAAHSWPRKSGVLHMPMGRYEEPLRNYLHVDTLGAVPFPEHMALRVFVSAENGSLCAICNLPEPRRQDGFQYYDFSIPGMVFQLQLGAHLEAMHYEYSAAPSPLGIVSIMPGHERERLGHLANKYLRASRRR
jgi:hypothetical protein